MPRSPNTQFEIISLLHSSHILSAVEIQQMLHKNGHALNKTTVYRALDKMLVDGEICRHSLGKETLFYELRNHHHDHAVCERCGKVSILKCNESIDAKRPDIGFTPTHHHLTLFGVCKNCSS